MDMDYAYCSVCHFSLDDYFYENVPKTVTRYISCRYSVIYCTKSTFPNENLTAKIGK